MRLYKCILLQFMEVNGACKHERFLQENIATKWFCNFNLSASTQYYSFFNKAPKYIGSKVLVLCKIKASLNSFVVNKEKALTDVKAWCQAPIYTTLG